MKIKTIKKLKTSTMALAALLSAVMAVTSGCGAVTSLVGGSGGTKATTMWADVPAVDGAVQSNVDLPLPIRLAMKAFITAAANSDSSNTAKLENFDFIAYTTAKTPEEIKSFYTTEMMAGQGWNLQDQPGCAGGDAATAAVAGAFCLFGRDDGGKQAALIIVAAQDDASKETQLWYARFDGVRLGTQ
jgi:uncharacterized protein YceK